MRKKDALKEASDASTPPARLAQIAAEYYANEEIIEAIIQNPNSPLDLLAKTSKQKPLALLQNVGLQLLSLENPSFLRGLPTSVLLALVTEPTTPLWLVEACCLAGSSLQGPDHSSFYKVIARREHLSPALLEALSSCGNSAALSIFLRRPEVPSHCVARSFSAMNQGIRSLAARHPNAPKDLLALLSRVGASQNLERYQHPDPGITIEELDPLLDRGGFITCLALRHPNMPAERLQQYTNHSDYLVAVLQNPNATESFLASLSSHEFYLAKHPNTPPHLLRRILISSPYRRFALQNPSSPQDLVALIQRVEAQDLSVTEEELQALAAMSKEMQSISLSHPNISTRWLSSIWSEFIPFRDDPKQGADQKDLFLTVSHPNIPVEILTALADLATGPSTNVPAHYILAKQKALAHPKLPADVIPRVIDRSSSYHEEMYLLAIAGNPNLQPSHLSALAAAAAKPKSFLGRLRRTLLQDKRLAADSISAFISERRHLRSLIAKHPNTATKDLSVLLDDPEPHIRFYAARHPNAPQDLLQDLIGCGATPDLFAISCRQVVLPQEKIQQLMQRGVFSQRLAASACREEHQSILWQALYGKHPRVREEAARNRFLEPKKRSWFWQSSSHYTKAALAQNPAATAKELWRSEHIRFDGGLLLYRSIASNRGIDPNQLVSLSEAANLVEDVAHNPSASPELLQRLSSHRLLRVRSAVAMNPSTPTDALTRLLRSPLRAPLGTARLHIVEAKSEDIERNAKELLPIFQSNPELVEMDEGKREYTIEDAKRYLQGDPTLNGSRVFLVYRRAPLTTRIYKDELAHAGEELIATISIVRSGSLRAIEQSAASSLWIGLCLIHGQCHRQGLGRELMCAIERYLYSHGHRGLHLAVFQEGQFALTFWNGLGYEIYEDGAHPLGQKVWRLRKSLTI